MGASSTVTMTFEEFEQLPDEPGKLELLEGELLRMPPPEAGHMEVCKKLFKLLDQGVENLRDQGIPVGELFYEMGYLMAPGNVDHLP